MKMEELTLNESCLDKTFLPSLWEGSSLMRMPKDEVPKSSSSLGRVLIVSGDPIIRDFLGQMLRLHGYDCEYLEELPKVMMEHSWKGFDALFIESQFLEQFKHSRENRDDNVTGPPQVVVLGDLPPSDEAGFFRVLNKPLDYRQMGRVMDECFAGKIQERTVKDEEGSERSC